MNEQHCIYIEYLYRREDMPHSIRWHLNSYLLPTAPIVHEPGLVMNHAGTNQLSLVLAVPVSSTGDLETEIQYEYEDIADAHFGSFYPDQELA